MMQPRVDIQCLAGDGGGPIAAQPHGCFANILKREATLHGFLANVAYERFVLVTAVSQISKPLVGGDLAELVLARATICNSEVAGRKHRDRRDTIHQRLQNYKSELPC